MYCDFYSVTDKEDDIPTFFRALIKEIELCKSDTSDWIIDTIFIGGGTPSLTQADQLEKVIQALKNKFDLSNVTSSTFAFLAASIIFFAKR